MFSYLLERHQRLMLFILFCLLVSVGYGELKILNNVTAACTTWFFALLIGVGFIVKIFNDSLYGQIFGILFFTVGIVVLFNFWRRSPAKK